MDSCKIRIHISQGAYIFFWRYKTAWPDARPFDLGRQNLKIQDKDHAIRKAGAWADWLRPTMLRAIVRDVLHSREGPPKLTLWLRKERRSIVLTSGFIARPYGELKETRNILNRH